MKNETHISETCSALIVKKKRSKSIDHLPQTSPITCTAAFRKITSISRETKENRRIGKRAWRSPCYRGARLGRSVRDKKKGERGRKKRDDTGSEGGRRRVLRCLSPLEKSRETVEIFLLSRAILTSKIAARNNHRSKRARFRVVPQAGPRAGTGGSAPTSRMPAGSYRPLAMHPCVTSGFLLTI